MLVWELLTDEERLALIDYQWRHYQQFQSTPPHGGRPH